MYQEQDSCVPENVAPILPRKCLPENVAPILPENVAPRILLITNVQKGGCSNTSRLQSTEAIREHFDQRTF